MALLQVPGVRINYLGMQASRALIEPPPLVVLIHGLAANMAFWHPGIALPLSRACHLLAYDLRGHGRSGMPRRGYALESQALDLEELLDQLDLEAVHLVGHSFGGAVAALAALRWPQRVQSLTLVDTRLRALQPTQRMTDWPDWPRLQMLLTTLGIELDAMANEGGLDVLTAFARLQLTDGARWALARQQLRGTLPVSTRGGRRSAGAWLKLLSDTEARRELELEDSLSLDRLQQLRLPLLGVYAMDSPNLPTAKGLSQLCPHMELHWVGNAGHFFPLTHPRRLLQPLGRFLLSQLAEMPPGLTELLQGESQANGSSL